MIEEYRFGLITIDGKTYDHDIEVRWSGAASDKAGGEPSPGGLEVLGWWRAEGHFVDAADVEGAVEENPEVIVIGTGAEGRMEVSPELIYMLRARGIQVIVDRTEEATKTFNVIKEESKEEEGRQARVIGLFHLTC